MRDANWTKFEHTEDGHVTKLFGISYQSDVGQHILCTGMYEYQADWLLTLLKTASTTGTAIPTLGDFY